MVRRLNAEGQQRLASIGVHKLAGGIPQTRSPPLQVKHVVRVWSPTQVAWIAINWLHSCWVAMQILLLWKWIWGVWRRDLSTIIWVVSGELHFSWFPRNCHHNFPDSRICVEASSEIFWFLELPGKWEDKETAVALTFGQHFRSQTWISLESVQKKLLGGGESLETFPFWAPLCKNQCRR